jgi:hypothetical protein
MAITRRTTTVTEHFGSSSNEMTSSGTEAPGTGQSSLESVKTKFSINQTSANSIESIEATAEANNLSIGPDIERFSKELHGWLGQRTINIVFVILGLMGSVVLIIWNFANKLGQAEVQMKTAESAIVELKSDNKLNTERILKLEIQTDSAKKK